MPTIHLTEALETFNARAVAERPGVFRIDLITPGWGSSGYYDPEVLETAAAERVFAAGTHMYIDHQTAAEGAERPEGSLMNLAAVLTEDATWSGTALTARAKVFSSYAPALAEMREHIGVSIRAAAEVSQGEADGRRGQIIDRLVEATSVDFVTRPGRGGQIAEILEAALGDTLTRESAMARLEEARNVGHWIESRLHLELTNIADDMFGDGRLTREERISLSSAIGQALTTFASQLEAEQPQLFSRDLWEEPTAFLAAAESDPVIPAGPDTSHKEDTMPEIEEARLRQLETDAGRVTALESERDAAVTERDEAIAERDTARTEARDARIAAIIAEADAEFDEYQADGLVRRAAEHVDESGVLDEAAFGAVVTDAAAAVSESNGEGTVLGFGRTASTAATQEAELREANDKKRAKIFGRPTKEA